MNRDLSSARLGGAAGSQDCRSERDIEVPIRCASGVATGVLALLTKSLTPQREFAIDLAPAAPSTHEQCDALLGRIWPNVSEVT